MVDFGLVDAQRASRFKNVQSQKLKEMDFDPKAMYSEEMEKELMRDVKVPRSAVDLQAILNYRLSFSDVPSVFLGLIKLFDPMPKELCAVLVSFWNDYFCFSFLNFFYCVYL
jgi:hypothetical protein